MEEGEFTQIELKYKITPAEIERAWCCVRNNGRAAGIDGITIDKYEENLENNLDKLWRDIRTSRYVLSPVRHIEIPKEHGDSRSIGIFIIKDRIVQTIVKFKLESIFEPVFFDESYGYRPNKKSRDAVEITKKHCRKYKWGIKLDIRNLFGDIDHEGMMITSSHYITEEWILFYIREYIKIPIQKCDGTIMARVKGIPQGGVISPILSNLFLHDVLDCWLKRHYPHIPFIRYADDIICHCVSEAQARFILQMLRQRMARYGLIFHPEKTIIFNCEGHRNENNLKDDISLSFTFLGHIFRAKKSTNRKTGKIFNSFVPISIPNYNKIYWH